jgi:hypothetical protein
LDPHKKEFNIMSAFFSNILSSFSPLRCNHRESISTSGGEDVSGENVVAAAAVATTVGVVGGDFWETSIESPVAEATVTASSLTLGRTVGRASKQQ